MRLVGRLFLTGLGAVYWLAFRSLRPQVRGLYGARGIRPIGELLDETRAMMGRRSLRALPTLLWLGASDRDLVRLCRVGERCALLLVAGVAPRLMTMVLWASYLSFVAAGSEFLGYQWDVLLLEAGLDAILVAPRGLRPWRRRPPEDPPWAAIVLLRWLLFRLYFESGLCKLQSRDPAWRRCTACAHHYETQPLPTPLAWWARQLPPRVQQVSTALTLAIECGAPLCTFAFRRGKRIGFAVLTAFQLVLAATGNFGFFNLLTAVLGLWLLDDAAFGRPPARRAGPLRQAWTAAAAAPLLALSTALLLYRFDRRVPRPLARLYRALSSVYAVNPYGLFAVMTTRRPEIVIEGSNDGLTWREYVFRYKPGPLDRPPPLVAPHQPRLDWQMWFAALAPVPDWFPRFLVRLLEGAPEVVGLLEATPFAGPPRYVRALMYNYTMTDRATRRATGRSWNRELVGVYYPGSALTSQSCETFARRQKNQDIQGT